MEKYEVPSVNRTKYSILWWICVSMSNAVLLSVGIYIAEVLFCLWGANLYDVTLRRLLLIYIIIGAVQGALLFWRVGTGKIIAWTMSTALQGVIIGGIIPAFLFFSSGYDRATVFFMIIVSGLLLSLPQYLLIKAYMFHGFIWVICNSVDWLIVFLVIDGYAVLC